MLYHAVPYHTVLCNASPGLGDLLLDPPKSLAGEGLIAVADLIETETSAEEVLDTPPGGSRDCVGLKARGSSLDP